VFSCSAKYIAFFCIVSLIGNKCGVTLGYVTLSLCWSNQLWILPPEPEQLNQPIGYYNMR